MAGKGSNFSSRIIKPHMRRAKGSAIKSISVRGSSKGLKKK
jgi:hypothetical protein